MVVDALGGALVGWLERSDGVTRWVVRSLPPGADAPGARRVLVEDVRLGPRPRMVRVADELVIAYALRPDAVGEGAVVAASTSLR